MPPPCGAWCCACSSRSASRRATPAGTTRCTCSASCGPGRASSRFSGVRSRDRSPGCTCRAPGGSTCSDPGGSAPRAVVAHEVVHALQDEHFRLTRGPFAPRPRDHDGELAAQALVEGDATEVQSRYVAALSPIDLDRRAGAHAARRARARPRTDGSVPRAPAGVPRTRRDRSSCARCVHAAGSDCSTAPSATLRGRPRRCSTRPATWPAIRRRRPSAYPPGATVSRPRSGPRTWWR